MTIYFNDNVEICYKDRIIFINNEQFELNSRINKIIKNDFVFFLIKTVHNKKENYNKDQLEQIFNKEKYINLSKFTKLLFYIKNKLLFGDYVFSSNEYVIDSRRRKLYRKYLIYVLKYELECVLRIQSLYRGYIIRKKLISIKS